MKTKINYIIFLSIAVNSLSYTHKSFIIKLKDNTTLASVLPTTAGIDISQEKPEGLASVNIYTLDLPPELNEAQVNEVINELKESEAIEYIEENFSYYIDNLPEENPEKSSSRTHKRSSSVKAEKKHSLSSSLHRSSSLKEEKKKGSSQPTSLALNYSHNITTKQQKNAELFSLHCDDIPLWSRVAINALLSKEIHLGDPSTYIALIDTGVDTSHPSLLHSFSYELEGYNAVNKKLSIEDLGGHGTHCAGILVGSMGFKNPIDNVCGLAPLCMLIPIKAMTSSKGIQFSLNSALIEAIMYAADKGAKVINMSFSSPKYSPFMQEAICYAQAKGCLLVAAAGNYNTDEKHYPAAYKGVLSVGAIDCNNEKLEQSNYGSWVDVCGPGKDIHSTFPNNSSKLMSGTSMACPHVAGLAALLFSLGGENITAKQVKKIIQSTCIPVNDSFCKYGLIDAQSALENYCMSSNTHLFSPLSHIAIELGNRKEIQKNSMASAAKIFLPCNKTETLHQLESEAIIDNHSYKQIIREEFTFDISQEQIGARGIIQMKLKCDQPIKYKISIYDVPKGYYIDLITYKKYQQKDYSLENKINNLQITEKINKNDNYISSDRKLRVQLLAKLKNKHSILTLLTKKNEDAPIFNLIISNIRYVSCKIHYFEPVKEDNTLSKLPIPTLSLNELSDLNTLISQ